MGCAFRPTICSYSMAYAIIKSIFAMTRNLKCTTFAIYFNNTFVNMIIAAPKVQL